MLVKTQETVTVHCATCGHFRIRHVKGIGCMICAFEIAKGWRNGRVCMEHFTSRLTDRERDQARAVDKESYKGTTQCATCLEIWWAHDGMVCPNGETLFVPLVSDL